MSTLAAAFPQALVTSLGKAANGVTLTESFAIPSATATPTFWADMQKYQPSAARSSQALLGWIEVNLVKQVAAQAKAYDHQSLLAALKQTASVDIEGMGGPVNFTQPNADSSISRIFAHYDFVYKVEGGVFTPQDGGKGVNVSSVLP
jgi:ABC-type branched-subunit amino acid transport system substrate-binding protein